MQAKNLAMYVIGGAALALAAGVAGVHLAGFLFVIIVLCPLMMLFMMTNMGAMHGGSADRSARNDNEANAGPRTGIASPVALDVGSGRGERSDD